MRDRVLTLLERECPDVDFDTSNKLASDGILDSLSITTIIAAFTMEFGITIPYEEIIEENFDSVGAMTKLVERLMPQGR